jgi:8-oxo-dGTP pyrophosphatase MutT (NUDIX family)
MDGTPLRQVAALPYRQRPSGEVEVLILTSRETQRFIIPKGWQPKKLSGWKAAAREAEQEAGLEGKIAHKPIGSYLYWKRLEDHFALVEVDVYPLKVTKCRKTWREKSERLCQWLTPQEAALIVDEPGLMAILQRLALESKPSSMQEPTHIDLPEFPAASA